ncbi:iron-containing alcohol dehydrogenase [Candidatus Bathyarchaeota archaeon]|nr:iron-containing alcohol dehydrogenase [Candidatus Bathyarchaeota archaeon]
MSFKIVDFYSVRNLVFGMNAIEELGERTKQHGRYALIITDKVLEKIGTVDKAIDSLKKADVKVEIFDECEAEPRLEIYERAKDAVRELKPEIVIGIGGGSNMDVSKVAAALATNEGDAIDYILPIPKEHEVEPRRLKARRLPLILVPTTSGTGSEVTRWAVVTVKGKKWDFKGNVQFLCDNAIVDPMLASTMPPKLTASTGIDALSHAIEAVMSNSANFMSLPYSLKAIELISKYLRRAYVDGEDLEARYYMSMAATYAGVALCNVGVVLAHAIAYTFAAQHKIPHGVSCGIALPYAMEYNLPLIQDKLAKIGEAMGVEGGGDQRRKAKLAIAAVYNLLRDLGMPASLKEAGIGKNEIPSMIEDLLTVHTYLYPKNPRKVEEESIRELYERMWEGRILESS